MAKLRCGDCGTVFESNIQECPTCGCPASACTVEIEQPQPTNGLNSSDSPNTTNSTPINENEQSNPIIEVKRKMHPFEVACYALAIIFAILWLLQPTTSGGYANAYGANQALMKEIAAFGFLIAGRLTAILNK